MGLAARHSGFAVLSAAARSPFNFLGPVFGLAFSLQATWPVFSLTLQNYGERRTLSKWILSYPTPAVPGGGRCKELKSKLVATYLVIMALSSTRRTRLTQRNSLSDEAILLTDQLSPS
jgi:hypothetical protein